MGRLFQRRGAAIEKARLPQELVEGFRKKQFDAGAEWTGWDIWLDET